MASLIASGTEMVDALGLGSSLVGVSHECDFPDYVAALPRFSNARVDPTATSQEIDAEVRTLARDGRSAYRLDEQAIRDARPDVIITQDICDVCAVALPDVRAAVSRLDLPSVTVCPLTAVDLEGVAEDFRRVGQALGAAVRAERLATSLFAELDALHERTRSLSNLPRVVFIEWLDPPMIGGGWIPELAVAAGCRPLIVDRPGRFERVRWSDIAAADPDYLVIVPCGFTVQRSVEECRARSVREGLARVRAAREGRCLVVDGHSYFNRPGPRLAEGASMLHSAIHGTDGRGLQTTVARPVAWLPPHSHRAACLPPR